MKRKAMDLVGTWTLKRHLSLRAGEESPTGHEPGGLLIYAATGHMMVAINFSTDSEGHTAPGVFYAGTFMATDREVHHFVTLSSDPKRIGKTLTRTAELDGTLLSLTVGDREDGAKIDWERI